MKLAIFFLFITSFWYSSNGTSNRRQFNGSTLEIVNQTYVSLNLSDASSARFFILSDWGGVSFYPYRTIVEQAVSFQMTLLARQYATHFQIALGDNFYFDGVANASDKRFNQTFEDVFVDDSLKETPWFFVMGNHDHYGNASAQIEYTRMSERWILPNYNYSMSIKLDNGSRDLIEILMIDTVLLCGHTYEHEEPKFKSLKDKFASHTYFKALETRLKEISLTRVPYVLVGGHFPVWSISAHGPTQCLVDKLRPLLHKYKVSAYLCGHDHNLQHLTDTYMNATVEHILSGASNLNDNSTTSQAQVPQGMLKFFWGEPEIDLLHGGFAYAHASLHNMTITFLESSGKELYQKVIYPREFF